MANRLDDSKQILRLQCSATVEELDCVEVVPRHRFMDPLILDECGGSIPHAVHPGSSYFYASNHIE